MKLKTVLTSALAMLFVGATAAGVAALSGCTTDEYAENLQLHLAFDEGSGKTAHDSSGNIEDAEINYVFNNALYKEWRTPNGEIRA